MAKKGQTGIITTGWDKEGEAFSIEFPVAQNKKEERVELERKLESVFCLFASLRPKTHCSLFERIQCFYLTL